jgi:hypothetical protein
MDRALSIIPVLSLPTWIRFSDALALKWGARAMQLGPSDRSVKVICEDEIGVSASAPGRQIKMEATQ